MRYLVGQSMSYYDKSDGYLCDDEMIAVDGGGHGDLGQTGGYKLKHGHLSGGVLHRYTVRPQSQVRLASLNLLRLRVVQVRVEHLLRESQGPVQPTSSPNTWINTLPRSPFK